MHNARITECPHCNTAFRVSDAQLRAAKGAVRCGSCLEVFFAHQHWLSEDDQNDNSAELELDEWGDDPNAIFAELEQLDRDLQSTLDDESWALKLLEEEGEIIPDDIAPPIKPTVLSESASTHSEPAFVVLNEADNSDDNDIQDDHESQFKSDTLVDDIDEEIILPHIESKTTPANNGFDGRDMYDPLDDEGLNAEPRIDNEFDWDDLDKPQPKNNAARPARTKSSSNIFPVFIILSGLLGFAAQYVFFHLDELSQTAQWRPLIQTACEQLDCTIPQWQQFNAIQHDDLVVRSHPSQANALLINVRLTNASAFPQAFPILDMRFSDINGNEIGSRKFKPEEYLKGELSGLKLMPAQQPVQVELGIVDPGKDAVNYQLQLIQSN